MGTNRPSIMITGGAVRIGAAVARNFGAAGWHVIIHYGRSSREAESLADVLPSAETVHVDLSDSDASVALIKSLAKRLTDWRVLVNCAGVFEPDDVTDLDPRTFDRAMAVNARTPARMAQAYLLHARAEGGRRIIQFTDQKLENPNPDFFSYTLSKHALAATVPLLAMGAAGADDRIYGLAPGAILPSHDQTPDETRVSHRLNLLERRTGVEEVADACRFLAEGSIASGQTLYVDSGQHLLNQPRDVIYLAREMAGN